MNDIGFISKDMALAIKGYDVSAMPMLGNMRLDEVYNRFCNSYIIKVERSESIDGTLRISREIPKISG